MWIPVIYIFNQSCSGRKLPELSLDFSFATLFLSKTFAEWEALFDSKQINISDQVYIMLVKINALP
jgi:hypothetical protein